MTAGRARASDAILRRLSTLHPQLIDLSLGRIRRLLAALDHPERALPPVIHVAGTNAKGSVIACLRAMFEAAGLSAHVYTSPHLVRFNERIRVAGRLITDAALVRVLEDCENANDNKPITIFEISTAAAFLAFARTPADIALIETGLGGRFDATNVVARPAVTVITPVALDHQHFLGNRLVDIAGEKAGILKRGRPAVIGPQHAHAARVIAARAASLGAPLHRWGHEFRARTTGDGMVYSDRDTRIHLPPPSLTGAHQVANAATAIAAIGALKGARPDSRAIARGMTRTSWPARLQRLSAGTLSAPLERNGFELWLDGGHNPSAARALARTIGGWPRKPLYLVVGMVQSKDLRGFLSPLLPNGSGLWIVPVPGNHPARPPEEMAAAARTLGAKPRIAASVAEALGMIARRRPGQILVTGSLHLAGAVLEAEGRAAWPR